MRMINSIAAILLIVGGLNWGLVGAFNFNLVTELFGQWPVVVQVVYILVGLAALYTLVLNHSIYTKFSD